VIVTDSVMEAIKTSDWLQFENIGEVKLKGFDQPRALCRAQIQSDD
jgi:class 3 adenylate cyclase